MSKIKVLDLQFLDTKKAIGSFLIPSEEGLILIESGPESTYKHLQSAIENEGFNVEDVKHVLLTHIHFDHAGAAWKFAEFGAKIYVHPKGYSHMLDPEKLWNSAKMIYGDDMDRLWGKMQPIPENLLIQVDDNDIITIGEHQFKVIYTPGHAVHHNSYRLGDIIFTGDVGGVKIGNHPIVPPCPPPDINLELWKSSLDKLDAENAKVFYLTHFGRQENVLELTQELRIILDDWANWIKPYFDEGISAEEITPKFMAYTKSQFQKKGLSEEEIQIYEYANPSWMSVSGLLRYWKLKKEGRI
ncbi:MBL fold metallo-hydrolase [Chryseobacterium oryctis]|uniref:MBL fold metallo-hydrolase n=1 Tax=Chryseobacterium oryctis TaxID=2952618 RepID=A0ABT3HMI6_9FLAO|nr:MBL fold metallo-hydrolase [Chryseobacterium oryctis]MCW3161012.1 MBL fold metallo-hydrolase [Chryseobacterium oryctis]